MGSDQAAPERGERFALAGLVSESLYVADESRIRYHEAGFSSGHASGFLQVQRPRIPYYFGNLLDTRFPNICICNVP